MKATLTRRQSTDFGTPGELILETGWSCNTLELPWNGNQRGISCVKAGTYRGRKFFSPRLNRNVVRLDDANGRQDVELHNGNFAGESSKKLFTQVHGCILPGREYSEILLPKPNPEGKAQYGITSSVITLNSLLAQLGEDDIELTIVWAEGAQPENDV